MWTNVRVADPLSFYEVSVAFAVKLLGELRGNEVRYGDHASTASVLGEQRRVRRRYSPYEGVYELMRKTALSGGGDGGREGKGWSWDRADRIGVAPEQRAGGAGVQVGGMLGARVVAGRISSLTKARSTSTG